MKNGTVVLWWEGSARNWKIQQIWLILEVVGTSLYSRLLKELGSFLPRGFMGALGTVRIQLITLYLM